MSEVQIVGDTSELRSATDLLTIARPDIVIAEASVGGTSIVPFLFGLQQEVVSVNFCKSWRG
jgi:hypothetical protein